MRLRYKILLGISVCLVAVLAILYHQAGNIARQFEPYIRDQAVQYLTDHFDADVQLASLKLHVPKLSPMKLWMTRGKGILAGVNGEGLVIRRKDRPSEPALLSIRSFSFRVDLGVVYEGRKQVRLVTVTGMEAHVPPKGDRPSLRRPSPSAPKPAAPSPDSEKVVMEEIQFTDAKLVLHPRDPKKIPLEFNIQKLNLAGAAAGEPMRYQAYLRNPKPPGQIVSEGTFGPWNREDPGDSPLKGTYEFKEADLGVFKAIDGTLQSTGRFEGALSSIRASGRATVPNFRLKMANNAVPLIADFDVLVDGTNGNTELRPVKAQLGSSRLVTSGSVIKHDGDPRRTITLDVKMKDGRMEDFLKLAMKGPNQFLTGDLDLNARIQIPPLTGKVVEKLRLRGTFDVADGKFLKSTIQDRLDELSRKGQGQPQNTEIDEVVSHLMGSFELEDQLMEFSKLSFGVPGADIDLVGRYDLDRETLEFRGSLRLKAKLSETQTGLKRWVLKPVDPLFSKNGSGTFLKIKIEGPRSAPKFGLDRGSK